MEQLLINRPVRRLFGYSVAAAAAASGMLLSSSCVLNGVSIGHQCGARMPKHKTNKKIASEEWNVVSIPAASYDLKIFVNLLPR